MSDPHPSGGSLADMAPDGTKIPEDAGTQRLIPAVPNPDQASQSQSSGSNLAAAATNPTDIPRSNQDIGVTGEVVTGKSKLLCNIPDLANPTLHYSLWGLHASGD